MKKLLIAILVTTPMLIQADYSDYGCKMYLKSYKKNAQRVKLDLMDSKTSIFARLAANDIKGMIVECELKGKEYEMALKKIKQLKELSRY